jgi:hypothetical protein
MSESKSSSGVGGISFASLLFLVFLVLKLCGVITWSWWWVTAPLWISAGIGLVILLFLLIITVIAKKTLL